MTAVARSNAPKNRHALGQGLGVPTDPQEVVKSVAVRPALGVVGVLIGAGHGAPGGSFRPAPHRAGTETAESCGNHQAHPAHRPERSSRSATTGTRRGRRTSWRTARIRPSDRPVNHTRQAIEPLRSQVG